MPKPTTAPEQSADHFRPIEVEFAPDETFRPIEVGPTAAPVAAPDTPELAAGEKED